MLLKICFVYNLNLHWNTEAHVDPLIQAIRGFEFENGLKQEALGKSSQSDSMSALTRPGINLNVVHTF